MISMAKTFEIERRRNLLASLKGFVRRLQPTLLILMSPVAVSAAIEIDGKIGLREIAAAEITMKPATRVTFQTVSKGYRSGVREPQQIVVRSQAEWNALWGKHVSSETKPAPPPVIDFAKELVVGIFLGEKPTGGYDTTIVRAEQSDDTLVIYYQEKTPASGSMVIQVFMQPFHIVRMNREVGSKVTFRRES